MQNYESERGLQKKEILNVEMEMNWDDKIYMCMMMMIQ